MICQGLLGLAQSVTLRTAGPSVSVVNVGGGGSSPARSYGQKLYSRQVTWAEVVFPLLNLVVIMPMCIWRWS